MAYDKEQLDALLARVEAATGPDRSLAKDLAAAVLGGSWKPYQSGKRVEWLFSDTGVAICYGHEEPMRWFSSIDAALALVERVLPGWDYELTYFAAHGVIFILWDEGLRADWEMRTWSEARTAPLAIIASLLKAIIANTDPLPARVSVGDPEGRDD